MKDIIYYLCMVFGISVGLYGYFLTAYSTNFWHNFYHNWHSLLISGFFFICFICSLFEKKENK